MRRVDLNNIDRLSYREGGSCLALIGLPFLAFGIITLVAVLCGTVKTKGGAPAGAGISLLFFTFLGLPFTAVGMALVFGRWGIIFDKISGTVNTWWGILFVPLRTKTSELAAFNMVSLSCETHSNDHKTYTIFPIRLAGVDGAKLDICAGKDERKTRVMAEEIAKFIGFNLVDSIGGIPDVRASATLGESLREQAQNSVVVINISVPPPGMRSTFTAKGNQIVIELALLPFDRKSLLLLIVPSLFFLVFFSCSLDQSSTILLVC